MDKVNVLSNSNEFVSPTPPKWDNEPVKAAPQESTNAIEILTDEVFHEYLFSNNVEGFVARAKEGSYLPSDKKIESVVDLIKNKKFAQLQKNVRDSILEEYQLTPEEKQKLSNSSSLDRNLRDILYTVCKHETFLQSVTRRAMNATVFMKRGDILEGINQVSWYPLKNTFASLQAVSQNLIYGKPAPTWQAAIEEEKNRTKFVKNL